MATKDRAVMKMSTTEFTWKIENFSKLKEAKVYSDTFLAGGYRWRILVYPNGSVGYPDYLSVYLDFPDWQTMPNGWKVPVFISLTLVDQLNATFSVRKYSGTDLSKDNGTSWGFCFVSKADLQDPRKGLLVGDTLLIEAAVCTEAAASEAAAEPSVGDTSNPFSLSSAELASRNLIAELSSMTLSANPSSNPDHGSVLLQQQRKKLVGFLSMSVETMAQTESLDHVENIARQVAEHAATDPREKAILKELVERMGEFKEVVPSSLAAIERSNLIESSVAQLTKGLEVRKILSKMLLSNLVAEAYRLGKEGMKLEAEIQQLSAHKRKVIEERNSITVELEKANQDASNLLEELQKQRGESEEAVQRRMRAQEKLAESNSSWKLLEQKLGW
ncbi:unnamed protein product [Linum tenue]|uniref:MATH domain-containing protein n=1 Tax=Linum tenue TaxID=586396 RepID=A0AAV0J1W9_9ROSI|nr:unnamed protein product [Linum tenue]